MLKIIVVVLVLAISEFAYAATDYTCMNDCTQRGYMYNYCKDRCSYDDNPYQQQQQQQQSNPYQIQPMKQTDFTCMSDCQKKGYMYNYCKEQCSY